MRCPPVDVPWEVLIEALDSEWGIHANVLNFVPEGAGAYHWMAEGEDGQRWFVTCDDLDLKPWLGADRASVLIGLNTAYLAAHSLRETAGLRFVVGPIPTITGELTSRLDARHTLAVLPYLEGVSRTWGDYLDSTEREQLLGLLVELHNSSSSVHAPARSSTSIAGRRQLEGALGDLEEPWSGGVYSELLREELHRTREVVTKWLDEFDAMSSRLKDSTSPPVVTHGEPHPGNLMSGTDGLWLIDWDTIAMDRPERDLWMLEDGTHSAAAVYERMTGRAVDPSAMALYRRAWALSDLAVFVTQLRAPHKDDDDSRTAWDSITSILSAPEPRPFGDLPAEH